MYDLIVDCLSRHFSRPPDNKGHAQRGFPCCEVRAAPGSTETIVSRRKLGPVVGREDEDRIVADSKLVHRIEQLTDVRVDLCEDVGEITVVGFVLKVRRRDRWHVW